MKLVSAVIAAAFMGLWPTSPLDAEALPAGVASTLVHEARLFGLSDPVGRAGGWLGHSIAISGDTAVVGSPGDFAGGPGNAGAVFVYLRSGSTWTLQQKLVSPNEDVNRPGRFGSSVAISGDTLVVGEPNDYNASRSTGAAHVFVRSGGVWAHQQELLAPDGGDWDYFGISVALSFDTAVVGAYAADTSAGPEAGAAYAFVRTGAAWTLQRKLEPAGGSGFARFGSSVAIEGDRAAVGAWTALDNGVQTGLAYVFVRSGAAWSQEQRLAGSSQDFFGESLAISGDTLLVGASSLGSDTGSAYVFVRSGTNWALQKKLLAADRATGDRFGSSVSLFGDLAVVGAFQDDTGAGADAGSAYVFARVGTSWTQAQKLTASDAAAQDYLGSAVALSSSSLFVGAIGEDAGGALDAGTVYAFGLTGSVWTERQKLVSGDDPSGDLFGQALALDGDTLAVGAPQDDTAARTEGGAVSVFVRSGGTWSAQQKLAMGDTGVFGGFGGAVSVSADTLVVGAPLHGNGSGAAYVFLRSSGQWSLQQKLVAPAPALPSGQFGRAVAVSGNTAVIGAWDNNLVTGDPGAAFVFVRSGTTWTLQQKLVAGDAAAGDGFGESVAVAGDTAVVGAPYADLASGTDGGAAYVFVRSGVAWSQERKVLAPDAGPGHSFGRALALSADTLLGGAPGAGGGRGAAYAFERSGGAWQLLQKIEAIDVSWNAAFGNAVALSGDRAAVGAYGDSDMGSAYAFVRSGATWGAGQRLLAPDGDAFGRFGMAVGISAEVVAVGDFRHSSPTAAEAGSVDVFALGVADLAVTKTDGASTAAAGGTLTYTIVVTNAGPHGVVDARVVDLPPAPLTCSSTCAGTPGTRCGKGLLVGQIDDWLDLPAGQSVTYRSHCTVSPSASGTIANTASVAVPVEYTDPDPLDDTATDVDSVSPGLAVADAVAREGAGSMVFTVTLSGEPATAVGIDYATSDVTATAGVDYTAVSGRLTFPTGLASPQVLQIPVPVVDDGVREGTEALLLRLTNATGAVLTRATAQGVLTEEGSLGFWTLAPCRLVDTRDPSRGGPDPLPAGQSRTFALAGLCGIPPTATAVSLNVTATAPTEMGHLRTYPSGGSLPPTSTVNYRAGQTRANNAVAPLGTDGGLSIYVGQALGTVHVILDVNGYFE